MSDPVEPTQPPATPRHAATVILVREQDGRIEVLLTRRHEKMAFMGGMWVFPGGTLCPADTSTESLAQISAPEEMDCERMRDLRGQPLPRSLCHGLAMAAHRETFEETGILLARTTDGHDVGSDSLARMQERRRAILSHPELFATLLQVEHLRIDVQNLMYWAHWITPANVPKRFDTRFFLARLPPQQSAVIDAVEATEMTWMTPEAAIANASNVNMTLPPPTLFTLMELDASVRQHVALEAIFVAEVHRVVVPILPKLVRGEHNAIVMPWDAEYHKLSAVGAPLEISYPQRFRSLPSRVSNVR